ncbi:non-hydrolyzing UDP-N-acetylglucosamine 2-epimerase [Actinocorallia populi]|uniref:non-hydrolyzing UDP-N-acetylglucosamine 2-epimerase n=1 Tax=Actinocorallia populi TaxID=2079200 RepID=UPI0018E57A71|nr:UDP-N-acetylglucosamine 2-epimerase (non-hydrolyzing) [Actinocorallia populi]
MPTFPEPVRAMIVLGTRPEAIKLAPVARAMAGDPLFEPVVVNTGQHREMLEQMLHLLEVKAVADLAVMRERQDLAGLTGRLVDGLGRTIAESRPDLVVVQGDTTTAMCGALAAGYHRIPVAHVEAGLRTGDLGNPFPEEINRQLIGRISRWHFAPTERSAGHLRGEGVPDERIEVTGNTVIDNLLWMLSRGQGAPAFRTGLRRILVTLHRRESQGAEMTAMARSLRRLADRGDCELLLPLHKSPAVRESLLPVLDGHDRVTIVEPLGYADFAATLAACDLVLTDSGGVQEEAPSLGKPVLVLRATTERPEAVEAGAAKLIGTDAAVLYDEATRLLDDHDLYAGMANAVNPFGDGRAAERIIASLARDHGALPAGALT